MGSRNRRRPLGGPRVHAAWAVEGFALANHLRGLPVAVKAFHDHGLALAWVRQEMQKAEDG